MKRFILIVAAWRPFRDGRRAYVEAREVPNVQLCGRTAMSPTPTEFFRMRLWPGRFGVVRRCGAGACAGGCGALDDIEGGDPLTFAMQLLGSWGRGFARMSTRDWGFAGRAPARNPFQSQTGHGGVLRCPSASDFSSISCCLFPRGQHMTQALVAGVEACRLLSYGELDFGPEPERKNCRLANIV